MAIRRTLAEFSDEIVSADLADNIAIAGTLDVAGAVTFNEGSADVDFRVESNGNANMLVVDGGNDRVGVGTAAPTKILDIHDTKANVPTLRLTVTDTATDSAVNDVFGEIGFISLDSDNPGQAYIKAKHLRSGTGHGATDMGLAFGISGPNSSTTYQTPYDAMVIDNSGKVGIGTTAPAALLHVYSGTANAELHINCGNSSESFLKMGRIEDAGECYISYNGSELGFTAKNTSGRQMILNQTGQLGIGLVPDRKLCVTGNSGENCAIFRSANTSGVNMDVRFDASSAATDGSSYIRFGDANSNNGSITSTGSGTTVAFNTSSDYRLKENVEAMTGSLTRLMNLKPYKFNFKKAPDIIQDGFFAHEAGEVVPMACSGEKDAMTPEVLYTEKDKLPEGKSVGDIKEESVIEPQGIDHSKFVPLLVGAIQELSARVATLEAIQEDSSSSNAALEARIIALENA